VKTQQLITNALHRLKLNLHANFSLGTHDRRTCF